MNKTSAELRIIYCQSIENAAESLQTDLSIQRDAMALSAVTGKTLLQQGVELLQGNCERCECGRLVQRKRLV